MNEINLEKETVKKLKDIESLKKKDKNGILNLPNQNKQKQNKQIDNKTLSKPKLDLQRPAFLTQTYTSYPNNNLNKFQNTQYSKSNDNIALITIIPHDSSSNVKEAKQLNKQELPSLSINPSSSIKEDSKPAQPLNDKYNTTINSEFQEKGKDKQSELNQKGIGIDLLGNPENKTQNEDLTNKNPELLEKRAIDWYYFYF